LIFFYRIFFFKQSLSGAKTQDVCGSDNREKIMSILDFPNLSEQQKAVNKTIATIEASAAMQARRQAEAEAFAEAEKRKAENEKLSEQHRQARERELAAEAETRRKEAARLFEENLRRQFFAKNPHASESDYSSVKEELKRQAMLANMDFGNKAEEVAREQINYSVM
jgi:actin-related protein